ncbi:MAG: DNA primase [Methylomonas sp.]|nr:DNA primase [Methylomonas sp.]PPD21443.1 MAG: DNA primase [Methylomonas sp.]PPD26040.1 MAG: DNA primase [Methylomonas sp.]PPD37760.1 MAG: DNA primase [Methylomonas sp.]PPD41432.1 MAG: DNA primase [Methylomonas sp.]
MSGRIPRQFIDDLLVRVDIVDLIDSHVPLKKKGSEYSACCPFHNEKTPSFHVNRQKQVYLCRGCGQSGNAISFLMAFNRLDFVEAVEDLATFVGVDVPREQIHDADTVQKRDASGLYDILSNVAGFYVEQLHLPKARAAIDYLKKRGVSDDVIREFGLGFAPEAWDVLSNRFERSQLIEAGLVVTRDDGRVYDRFRGRLMFPIRDKRRRVVGFGGRVLDDTLPKYLNSPETPVFSKSQALYGLCELLERQSRPKQVLVVEGYMDVIALTQFGIGNAVATLGTATSKAQIDLLFRFASELVFCFDGDNAGRQAAWKAVEAALPALRDGRQVRIMLLAQGHDPDSLVRAEGAEAFQARINSAQVLSDYVFDTLSAQGGLVSAEGRARLLADAKPLLEKLPAGFFRDMMFERLHALAGLRLAVSTEKPGNLLGAPAQRARSDRLRPSLLRRVIALLIQYPHLAAMVDRQALPFEGMQLPGQTVLHEVLRTIALEKPENTAILLEACRASSHEKVLRTLAVMELNVPDGGEVEEFKGALAQLMKQARQESLTQLLAKEKHEGLDEGEKQMLRELLKKRAQ